jgi:hypothetical protein
LTSIRLGGTRRDGCEAADSAQGNHTESTAADEGEVSECDTPFEIDGTLLSDNRVHQDPAVVGFDPTTGSAPDWMSVVGQGNDFCENDLVLNLQVFGSQQPSCYSLHVITDKEMYTVQTDGTGLAPINEDNGGQSAITRRSTLRYRRPARFPLSLRTFPTRSPVTSRPTPFDMLVPRRRTARARAEATANDQAPGGSPDHHVCSGYRAWLNGTVRACGQPPTASHPDRSRVHT